MAIRMIAEELYRTIKEVGELEKALRNAPYGRRAELEDRLRKARAEEGRLRGILESKKKE